MSARKRRRVEGFARWLWPLAATAGTLYAVYVVFTHIEFSRRDDGWILVAMGGCFLFAALVLLVFTRRWELRGLGQVVTYLADGALYFALGANSLGWRDGLSASDQNAIRSGFAVGGTFLVFGVLIWVWREYRDRPGPEPDPQPPPDPPSWLQSTDVVLDQR
jgi:hypothetical protein